MVCLSVLPMLSCATPAPAEETGPVRAEAGPLTEFSFEFDGRIIVPVLVDGKGPVRTILDSGLGGGRLLLLSHLETGKELGLEYARTVPGVRGAGAGEKKDLHLTAGDVLAVPGLELGTLPVGVMDESRSESSLHNAGVIGGLLLFPYTVEVDFDRSVIRMHDPEAFEAPDGWESVPLEFTRNLPILETTIRKGDRNDVPVRLIVDTGARPELGLRSDEARGIVPAPDAVRTLTGTGFRGDVFGQLDRVDELLLGRFKLEGLVAAFGLGDKAPILDEIGADGVLGIGALYRYNIIFDFHRHRMLLKPNRHASDPSEWGMAGVDIRPDAAGKMIIYHVDEGSEARARGLRKGDVVESVNGRTASSYSYLELKRVMEQAGETVELRVRRETEARTVRLALKRIV